MADTVLVHPNRDKAESKATRAVVILLLVTSAALILIVTIGGWSELQGMQIVSFGYAILYLVMAWFVGKWNRGVLPVAAGLAILFAVVAAVAGPAWFDRDKAGFTEPTLNENVLGLITFIIVFSRKSRAPSPYVRGGDTGFVPKGATLTGGIIAAGASRGSSATNGVSERPCSAMRRRS